MEQPDIHPFPVTRTAHYATLGTPGPHIRRFILACHGYGQVCEKFIRDLAPLADEHTYIVAPEGLSTFYWGGFEGATVSSWMTRRHRLDEIRDYSAYLSRLFERCFAEMGRPLSSDGDQAAFPKTILFGFSQGCATIMRWVMRTFPEPVDELVFWAGAIPEDLEYRPHLDYFRKRKLTLAYGEADPFLSPERLEAQRNMLAAKGLPIEEFAFSGAHEIPEKALAKGIEAGFLA